MATTYKIEIFDDAPILLFTAFDDYRMETDLEPSIKDIMALLEQQPQPMIYVQDVLKMKVNWEEILSGASTVARGENPLFHHPKVKKLIVTTVDNLLIQSFKGLAADAFGNAKVDVYPTLEQSLAAARAVG